MNHRIPLRATLALTLAAALAVTSGCATMDTATQKVGGIFGSKSETTKSATGGAIIGCAGGAVLARFIGGGHDMLRGCAAGAVVGGVASVQIHKHMLAEAQKTKAEVEQTPGVKATVATKSVAAKNDSTGQTEQVQALDRLTIDLPAFKVKAHAADIGRVVDKATALADQASEPTTITVEGPASLRTWIAARVHAGLKAGSTVKVLEADARTPALVISPVPAVAGAK